MITLILARMLSPNDFGVFSSILLFIYLMISMANSLIIQPLQVTLSHVSDEKSYLSFAFCSQIIVQAFIAISVFFVLWLELDILKDFNGNPLSLIVLVTGFLFHDFNRKLLLAKNSIYQALLIDVITSIVQIGVLLFAFFFRHLNLTLTIFVIGVSYIPSFLLTVFLISPSFSNAKLWRGYSITHYKQGRWLFLTSILQWWSSNLFVVASGAYLGMAALGAFRLVQQLFGVLNILLQTFENYVLPQAARLYKTSEKRSKIYLRSISLKAALAFGLVLGILFLFSSQIIVLAGGTKYAEYGYIVKGVAVLYFLIFLGYPIRMAIRILVLNRSFFIGYLLSFGFSLLTFNYLLKFWELPGVIFGIIGNQIILLVYWQIVLYRKNFLIWK